MEGDTLEEDILIGVIQDINSQKEADIHRKSQESPRKFGQGKNPSLGEC